MQTTLIAVVAVVVVAVLGVAFLLLRSRAAPTCIVRPADISRVFRAVASTKKVATFAILTFSTPDRQTDDDAVSVQFSIEDGRVGLDWVLVGPRNIEDQSRFTLLAVSLGHKPQLKERNKVRYLRVVDGEIPALCAAVVSQLYGLGPTDQMELIVEGIEWNHDA